MLDQNDEQWSLCTTLWAYLFKVSPKYGQEYPTHGAKNQHHHDKNVEVNKIIHKHHGLQIDKYGKPNFKGKRNARVADQHNTKHLAQ